MDQNVDELHTGRHKVDIYFRRVSKVAKEGLETELLFVFVVKSVERFDDQAMAIS
jgi:hypothetical protein